MNYAWFMPAYRGTLRIEAAYSLVHDVLWAKMHGHGIAPFHVDTNNVARARNWAIRQAINLGVDRLLMQDADCAGREGTLGKLAESMDTTRAAAVGALFCARKNCMNAEPVVAGQVYEGEVGTGAMLIDIAQVAKVEPPWFVFETSSDGSAITVGEDIYFCRRLKSHGLGVMVDARVTTVHVGESILDFQPSLAANATRDDAGNGRNADSLRESERG